MRKPLSELVLRLAAEKAGADINAVLAHYRQGCESMRSPEAREATARQFGLALEYGSDAVLTAIQRFSEQYPVLAGLGEPHQVVGEVPCDG